MQLVEIPFVKVSPDRAACRSIDEFDGHGDAPARTVDCARQAISHAQRRADLREAPRPAAKPE